MTAKIITVFNQKGGCGKTTISMHIAGALALRDKKVLLVDMDRQSTASHWYACDPDGEMFKAKVISLAVHGGNAHAEIRRHLEAYEYIVIDCPPAIESPIPESALLISDIAIIPVAMSPADIWASKGAKQLALNVKQVNTTLIIRTVANRVLRNTGVSKTVIKALEADTTIPMLETIIGNRTAFTDCMFQGTTVHMLPDAQVATLEANQLADEILETLAKG